MHGQINQSRLLWAMHPRNKHHGLYDFETLTKVSPELAPFVVKSKRGEDTVDFSDPKALKELNRALLKHFYGIKFWDIPDGFLCPPIPGRADYIHTVSDLVKDKKNVRALDIGVGANCVYPLIAHAEYGWKMVGSDIDTKAINSAQKIIAENNLGPSIELRLQKNKKMIFNGVIAPDEKFDLTICNPPFHESLAAATEGTTRKWRNLGKKNSGTNFGGQEQELWCPGGERAFIEQMIEESLHFKNQITIFTTLVSKEANLSYLLKLLHDAQAKLQVLDMSLGQKKTRILCWKF